MCEDNLIMECSISGNDLDIKDELTKIKHKLMNEIKRTHNALRNIKVKKYRPLSPHIYTATYR